MFGTLFPFGATLVEVALVQGLTLTPTNVIAVQRTSLERENPKDSCRGVEPLGYTREVDESGKAASTQALHLPRTPLDQ